MRGTIVIACAWVATGCAEGTAFVALPELPSETASWVIGHGVAGSSELVLHAADADHPVFLEARDTSQVLELVAYRETLAALQLAPGVIAQAAPGALSTTLPEGVATFVAQLDDTTASGWTTTPRAELLSRARLPAQSPCLRLAPTISNLPAQRDVTWAVSVDANTVLAGSGEPFAMRLTVGDPPQQLDFVYTSTTHGVASPRSGFRDARGVLWLGDHDGGLWRGEVGEDVVRMTRVVATNDLGQVRAMDGDPQDPERQLFMISTTGTIARFDGDRWATIGVIPHEPGTDTNQGLAWIGRDELFATTTSWPSVRALRGGVPEDVAVSDGEVGITGLKRVGPRQVAVGMSTGVVALHAGEAWTRLGRGGLALDVYTFIAWQQGFVYGGVYGYVGQWDPEAGFCSVANAPTAGGSVRFLLPFGDGLMAIGDAPRGAGNTTYTVLSTRLR